MRWNQEVALQGQFGNDELNKDELRRELEAGGVKDYPTTRKGRVDTLKCILCGVQRVPSLLMFSPECALGDLNIQDYEVLPFEPLHDLKGYFEEKGVHLPGNCVEESTFVWLRLEGGSD